LCGIADRQGNRPHIAGHKDRGGYRIIRNDDRWIGRRCRCDNNCEQDCEYDESVRLPAGTYRCFRFTLKSIPPLFPFFLLVNCPPLLKFKIKFKKKIFFPYEPAQGLQLPDI